MKAEYTERVRFNQLKEGEWFTFRKNGIVREPRLWVDDELWRYTTCDGNVLSRYAGAIKINNRRAWVWRVPN